MTLQKSNRIIKDVTAKILTVNRISENAYVHEYRAPEIADKNLPGQFVQIKPISTTAPLLRRPFSILKSDKKRGSIFVLFKVVGEGTELLAEKKTGEYVKILGPLGNNFDVSDYTFVFLIGGGVGIPPIYNLLSQLDIRKQALKSFFGAASKNELYMLDELESRQTMTSFSTDDGSYGHYGRVTELLECEFEERDDIENPVIAACGPIPMLAAVQRIALRFSVPALLSVESIMACGFGICMGCVLPHRDKNKGYSLVCKEGPVFTEKDLIL